MYSMWSSSNTERFRQQPPTQQDSRSRWFYCGILQSICTTISLLPTQSFHRKNCKDNESLSPTLTQGLIILISKPKKDVLLLDNWHPICLSNNNYKVLKLLSILDTITEESQSGFMNNRHIQYQTSFGYFGLFWINKWWQLYFIFKFLQSLWFSWTYVYF